MGGFHKAFELMLLGKSNQEPKMHNHSTLMEVLLEFKEYATEVDVDFVRKVVHAIGRCAIKLERAAESCISVLLELIKIKVNYVVQEAIIVIKDIFRRYPKHVVLNNATMETDKTRGLN
ncbi:hypothetical protein PIB30_073558 [Stylosanthes scabra]|uniref:Clathrin/coatomer adaptor adaptin-like N-terminal domain-containing protein n=1 Tax=Stylosanthes scabra TaxID=79078 RepID=A0ABU6RPT9_9FABA|nr:hypothetical protein [Stylosanthes scabra]